MRTSGGSLALWRPARLRLGGKTICLLPMPGKPVHLAHAVILSTPDRICVRHATQLYPARTNFGLTNGRLSRNLGQGERPWREG